MYIEMVLFSEGIRAYEIVSRMTCSVAVCFFRSCKPLLLRGSVSLA